MKITRMVSLLAVCLALSGCGTLEKYHWYRVAVIEGHETLDEYYGDGQTPAQPAQPQTLWPAYDSPDYCKHGYAGENEYREAAHAAAKAAGLDCIKLTLRDVPNPELSMHLFWYRSPVDGHYLATWYKAAKSAGITRWQVDISGCNDVAGAKDRFKDYPAGSVQWIEK